MEEMEVKLPEKGEKKEEGEEEGEEEKVVV